LARISSLAAACMTDTRPQHRWNI